MTGAGARDGKEENEREREMKKHFFAVETASECKEVI